MSAEPRFRVRRVVVRIPSRPQDHVDWDPTLKALLPKRKALEFLQAVLLGSAVDDGVPEEFTAHAGMKHCGLAGSTATGFINILGALEFPRVVALAG